MRKMNQIPMDIKAIIVALLSTGPRREYSKLRRVFPQSIRTMRANSRINPVTRKTKVGSKPIEMKRSAGIRTSEDTIRYADIT